MQTATLATACNSLQALDYQNMAYLLQQMRAILMPALGPSARSNSMPLLINDYSPMGEDGEDLRREPTWDLNPMRRMPGLAAAAQDVAARSMEHAEVSPPLSCPSLSHKTHNDRAAMPGQVIHTLSCQNK